jgi:uncharacterized protein YggU (UPF0235/DUF167 family)
VDRTHDGVGFWIHVTPRARRACVGPSYGDALRVSVREPPSGGRANRACLDALADVLGIARAEVELDPAASHRRKRVRVRGDPAELAARLASLALGPQVR